MSPSEIAAENIWPTRCIVCDTPGNLVCARCLSQLDFIEPTLACPRCGSPYGARQCCDCNEEVLGGPVDEMLPFDALRSACVFDDVSRRIVTGFKDRGEQRLSAVLASIMADYLDPDWPACAIGYIPASAAALRKRGFDHMELVARQLSDATGAPCVSLFERPDRADQRTLTRTERMRNMSRALHLRTGVSPPERILMIDDVCTTGASLAAAAHALKEAGCAEVRCLTFARVC